MAGKLSDEELVSLARNVLDIESRAVSALGERLGSEFAAACRICHKTPGRVVVSGMGKSGHVSSKIAATLASTGTPAFFMHPAEASHGDLGMITADDTLLAISYSGETEEILTIIPVVKRMGAKLVSITGNPASTLARESDVHLDVSVAEEACPLQLAPTASTTATLAMGDALAVALLENRGFTAEDFARSHPSGSLGKRLLLRVSDIMHSGEDIPVVTPDVRLRDGLMEMTAKGLGMTALVDDEFRPVSVFTDGDLRRALDAGADVHRTPMRELVATGCKTITENSLAIEAVNLLEEHRITALPVVDDDGRLVGALNIHDLFRAGIM
jgi:arabinose-5-phosphate isomerase